MLKIWKLFIVLMVGLLFVQCKPKEIVVTQTIRDTISTTIIEKVEVPINHTIIVDEPCDSLGILKQFNQTFKTEHATVTISNHNGSIVAEIDLDSIKQVWESSYVGKTEIVIKEIPVEVPKPFLPKIFWYSIGANVLALIIIFRKYLFKLIAPWWPF